MTEQLYNFAFLDNNNKVINIAVFDLTNPDIDLLENIKNIFNAVDYKSCAVYGEAAINGEFINDRFVSPKPYPSWILNSETYEWQAPIGMPIDDQNVIWDEDTLSWKPIVIIE